MATIARPGPPGVPVKAPAILPNKTLYVRNLEDKLTKDDLKRSLYMLFATYGVVLDIVACKTKKMRGQAHIVFRDVDSATQAMRALDNFTFFGKQMNITYAKGKSNIFSKLAGTFELPKEITATGQQAGQTAAPAGAFGSVPTKAVPINEADLAKGTKRGRDEDDDEDDKDDSEDEDAEMQMSESDSD